jgi:hypothetical protein
MKDVALMSAVPQAIGTFCNVASIVFTVAALHGEDYSSEDLYR